MLSTNGVNITVSRGDTATVAFLLQKLTLRPEDTVVFGLKGQRGLLTQASASGLSGKRFVVTVPSEFTRRLPAWGCVYDIALIRGGSVRTLMAPSAFIVNGVAHDVGALPPGVCIGIGGGGDSKMPEITIETAPGWADFDYVNRAFCEVSADAATLTLTRLNGESESVEVETGKLGNLEAVKRSQAYQAGDVVYADGIPLWGFLLCETAGITATTTPTYPTTEGGLASDGSVVWKLCRKMEEVRHETVTSGDIDSLF